MPTPTDRPDSEPLGRPDRLLTSEQLADYLAVSVAWVRKGILERRLPYSKIGKNVRFTPAQVEQIVKAGERPPLPAADDRPQGRGSARTKL